MKREFGISTNIECGTITETLDLIKAAGFKHIMLSELKVDFQEFEEAIVYAQKIGLNIPYVHLGYSHKEDLWRPGEADANAFIKNHTDTIRLCAKYGIDTAVSHIGCFADEETPAPERTAGLKGVKKILDVAAEVGVKIAVENMAPYDVRTMCYVLDNIDHPNLGFCYDCGHEAIHKFKYDLMARYGHRCFAVHLHDNQMESRGPLDYDSDYHNLPFDGKIDFDWVLKRIARSSYKGVLMMEVHRHFPWAAPFTYTNMKPADFLAEAYKRGEKLADMMEEIERKMPKKSDKISG
jgi:sugar phosphate isomerase/epimerase